MKDVTRAMESRSNGAALPDPAEDPSRFRRALLETVAGLFSARRLDAARQALEVEIPAWASREAPDQRELEAIIGLGIMLATFNRQDDALALMESVAPFIHYESKALELLGNLRVKAGRVDEGKANLLRANELGPARPSLMMALSEAAVKTGDDELARQQTRQYIDSAPVYITKAAETQVTVLAVPRRAGRIRQFDSPDRLHFPGGFVSQLFQRQPDVYRFVSIFVDSENALKAIAGAPKADLVFNAYAHPERPMQGEAADRLTTLIGVLGVRTINHPNKIRSAATETPGQRYAGLAGVVVPETRRYQNSADAGALARRIDSEIGFPLVVRPGMLKGLGQSFLVKNAQELEAAMGAVPTSTFQASRFHESRHADGLSRKMRAAVVGSVVQIVRVDYDTGWNVRPRDSIERAKFYLDNPALLEEERRICRDPAGELGAEAMERLRAVCARIPLDVFGIDFDVTEAGEILFFEASASMNLLNPGVHEAIDHPKEAEERLLTAFRNFSEQLKAMPRR